MSSGPLTLTIGSHELVIRPVIRLVRHLHLQRIAPSPSSWPVEATHDF